MKNLTVSVIIPNFNGEVLLQKNLPKLISAKNYKTNNILEIIIVDDKSDDGSIVFIKKNYPGVTLIKHTKNRGFSAAINTGVRAAKGSLVLLLNTDVAPGERFLEKVIQDFEDSSVFAVSLHEKGYGPAKGSFKHGFIELSMAKEDSQKIASFYVSGGSGVFRRDVFVKLGGMDEKLLSPFYWEDIDICYRAAKRGYKLIWEPQSLVEHDHESTIGKILQTEVSRIRERNQLLVIWKNITSANLTRKHIIGIFKRLLRHPGYIRIVLWAMFKINIVISKRKREIKECKLSDEIVFAKYV